MPEPLGLLRWLHGIVVRCMASNPSVTKRAAKLAKRVAARYPDEPLIQAQAYWTQGTAILLDPNYVCSLEYYDEALAWYAIACQRFGGTPVEPDVRVVHAVRIFCLSELGRYPEAQQAVEMTERW